MSGLQAAGGKQVRDVYKRQILKGTLIFRYEDHLEVLHEGDAVYYDSGRGHGMIAGDDADCEFLAIILGKKGDN